MDDSVPFGGQEYLACFGVLFFARGMDFLSTWIATPNLVLEANPLARKLGWTWGIPINFGLCLVFARWPLPALIISTTSVLVAGRNFQSAWLMRSMGEENYRHWFMSRLEETPVTLFLFCLFAQTLLVAMVGVALVYFAAGMLVPLGVGMGMVGYGMAVALYTLISLWRKRRKER